MLKIKSGFTLAEMMVVMLILSIVLAAMAPVMTTRNKTDYSSPWRYASNGSDAYFAGNSNSNQVAMIGQHEVGDGENNARLILRTSSGSGWSHLMFKTGDTIVGRLYLDENNLFLSNNNNPSGTNNTSVGVNALASANASSSDNTAIGNHSLSILQGGKYNSAIGAYSYSQCLTGTGNSSIGYQSLYNASGNYNTAIGYRTNYDDSVSAVLLRNVSNSTVIGASAKGFGNSSTSIGYTANATGSNSVALGSNSISANDHSIAIGAEAKAGDTSVGGASAIAIGKQSVAVPDNSIAIGEYANSSVTTNTNKNMIAIGYNTEASGEKSIAMGYQAVAPDESSIAIGSEATTNEYFSTAIGEQAKADKNAIAIGREAYATGTNSIAIGGAAYYATTEHEGPEAGGNESIAIGRKAHANGDYSVAIGYNACNGMTGDNKVCIGANSGPGSWIRNKFGTILSDNSKVIFLGDADTTVFVPGVLRVGEDLSYSYFSYNVGKSEDNWRGSLWVKMPSRYNGGREESGYITNTENDDAHLKFVLSDRRLKYVGKESTAGLDKIRQLKVFNYTFKKDKKKTPHVGVIAQDLQKVFPDAVKKGVDGFLTIRMEDMFYAVINAIKELDSRVTKLEKENQELEARIKRLEAKVK